MNVGILAAFLINEGYKMSPLLLPTVWITNSIQHLLALLIGCGD
jgi:hypothetical protein